MILKWIKSLFEVKKSKSTTVDLCACEIKYSCEQHKNYLGNSLPQTSCPNCWKLYCIKSRWYKNE